MTAPLPALRFPLARTLDAWRAHLPRALVAASAWARVQRAAAHLPAPLTTAIYLECRLAGGAGAVDLIFRVDAPGRDLLAARASGLPAGDGWEAMARFCARWAAGRGDAWRHVRHLWLELDLDPATPVGAPLPTPSVFVEPDPAAAAVLSPRGWTGWISEWARVLAPSGLSPGAEDALHGVLAARPPGARVPYAGFMLSRPGAAVRVYLAGLDASSVPRLLDGARWPGDPRIAATLGAAPPSTPPPGMLHLDVGDGVLPRLGVEYTLERRGQVRGVLAEGAFLDGLVARGLCSEAKAAGLRAWPGCETRTLPHELWPSRVVRRVNCIKLLFDGAAAPVAKGYLLAFHLPRLRGTGRAA